MPPDLASAAPQFRDDSTELAEVRRAVAATFIDRQECLSYHPVTLPP